MDSPIVAALIGLLGVLIGILGRDFIITPFLASQRRHQELSDRSEARARARQDLVRLYADPLRDATRSLRFRLDEIIHEGRARYLLANAPKTEFLMYKRISTIYRLAALLGWLQAIKRERSHLDPESTDAIGTNDPIARLERTLADGQGVEQHRLDELFSLWQVASPAGLDSASRSRLAMEIDGIRHEFLSARGNLSASELSKAAQVELSQKCATAICRLADLNIPNDVIEISAMKASVIFGIKEAYIYRDWQAAIGDRMLVERPQGSRHFDIVGFGEFEERYLHARDATTAERRWFDRLEALIHDLDINGTDTFDARRRQAIELRANCEELEHFLDQKISELSAA